LKLRTEISKIIDSYDTDTSSFEISVFEAISNALRYGQGGPDEAHVHIVFSQSEQRMYVRIKSDSQGFNLQKQIKKVVRMLLHADHWRTMMCAVRGRGFPLMIEGCQKVYFNHAGNDVLLIKHLGIYEELPLAEKIRILNV